MDINRILCPIDFSDFNQAANEYASMLAKSCGASIVYLYVSQPQIPYDAYAYVNIESDLDADLRILKETKPTIAGVDASHVVEYGMASDRIVEYANHHDIDLIVIGTHGRTGLKRVLMGSVAETVVRKAECPVLAIKTDARIPQTKATV